MPNDSLKFKIIYVAILFAGVFLLPKISSAATYYVSPIGSAVWPTCTTADIPCLADSTTAGKAFLGAGTGDTVYFLSGTYSPGSGANYEYPAWNPTANGGTFKCLSGTCTLVHTSVSPIFGSYGKSNITWDGFTAVSVAQMSIVRVADADYCTIQNCDLTGWPNGGSGNNPIIAGNGQTGSCSYLTIRNNKIHGSQGSLNSDGILFYKVDHATVENNEIYDNEEGMFDKAEGTYNTYRYNFVHDCGAGFRLGTETGSNNQHDINVYQNVFLNCGRAAQLYGTVTNGKSYIYFYNNTAYRSSSGGYGNYAFLHEEAGEADHFEVFDNIAVGNEGGLAARSSDTNTFYDYNDYYNNTYIGLLNGSGYSTMLNWRNALGGCPGTGRECNSNTDNPNFVNAGGTTAADYKRTSYPTNGRGGSYSNVMGAYITGNETIGYTPSISPDTTPPASPIGVTIS